MALQNITKKEYTYYNKTPLTCITKLQNNLFIIIQAIKIEIMSQRPIV